MRKTQKEKKTNKYFKRIKEKKNKRKLKKKIIIKNLKNIMSISPLQLTRDEKTMPGRFQATSESLLLADVAVNGPISLLVVVFLPSVTP